MKKLVRLFILYTASSMIAHATPTPTTPTNNTAQTAPSTTSTEIYNPEVLDESSTDQDSDPEAGTGN